MTSSSRRVRCVVVMLASLALWSVAFGDVTLTKNGKSYSAILIPENAGRVTETAAQEMQTYLCKISGATISIYAEEGFNADTFVWLHNSYGIISIGATRRAAEHGLTANSLAPEGFIIKSVGNTLFILGREDRFNTTKLRSTRWLSLYQPLQP